MTQRDLAWRGIGVTLVGVAISTRLVDGADTPTAVSLLAFLLSLSGLVLIVQGKRVPAALRVERSRHRMLAQAIRDRRRKHSGDGNA